MIDQKYLYPDVFLSEENRMIQQMVRDFVDKEIMPVRDQLDDDKQHKLINKIRQGITDLGIQKMPFPERYGGDNRRSQLTLCIIMEQLARGDLGIAISTGCNFWAWGPAIAANNKAVLDKFAPAFCGKELRTACYNMTEPDAGCDIENLQYKGAKLKTRARLEGDEWVINGTKMWATNSGIADLNCVPCTLDPNLGWEGIVMVYIPEPWGGVSHGPFENKGGLQADRNCSTYFDNVRVPKEWGIGPGGIAARLFSLQLAGGAVDGAIAAGVTQGAFETVVEYTGQRVAGGKPIRQHSIAAGILADMAIGIQMARLGYLAIAYMADHPEIHGPRDLDFVISRNKAVKVYSSEMAQRTIQQAMQLMGSYGYVREHHLEKYWRDAGILTLWLGGMQLSRFSVCQGYYDLD